MVLALVLAFVASAMNSLASTGFTREGRHLELIKYIPVPYKIQLSAKMFTAFILTVPSLIVCDIVVVLYLKLNLLWILILAALQLLCLVITTVLGLYLDSSHPHTLWDDEYSALRGNLNGFFDMALVMVISGLISLGAILFNAYFGWSTLTVAIYLFVILLVMAAYAVGVGIKKILINMDNL